MKARILPGWVLGIMLASGVTAPGGPENSAAPASTTVSDITRAAIVPAGASVPASDTAGQSPAPDPRLSLWALDVQRLAQAQVDEVVILAFVTNSTGIFNLSADQVIRFKDLGVSPQVINAMLQHDQQLLSGDPPLIAAAMPPPADSHFVASAISHDSESLIPDNGDYAPEQPESLGPVRAPYPVKLNDPIIILKLPCITVP